MKKEKLKLIFKTCAWLLFLSFLAMPCLAFAVRLDLGAASGVPGGDVTIPITLNYEGAAANISATSNDIGFDTALLENPRAVIGPAGTTAGKNVAVSSPSPGVFRVGVFGLNQNIIQNGEVASVTFTVKAGVAPGAVTLSNSPGAADPAGAPVTVGGSTGSINVTGAASVIRLDLGSGTGAAGTDVTISITLNYGGAAPNISATSNDIGFDTALLENPRATIGPVGTAAQKVIVGSSPLAGVFRVGVFGLNQNILQDGIVALVTFRVKAGASLGTMTLTNSTAATAPNGIPITVQGVSGSINVTGAAGAIHLDLGSGTGAVGTDVTIPITLNYGGAAPNISATSNDVGFDTALLENPRATLGPAGTAAGKDIVVNSPSAGVFRVGVLGINQNIVQEGTVAFVTFTVKAGVSPGNIALTNTPGAADPAGNPITVAGVAGSIDVTGPTGVIRLDLGSGTGAAGTDVTIPITLNYGGAAPNISATSNDIGFDTALLENPRAAIGPAGTAAAKNVVANNLSAGVFRVGVLGINQNIIQDGIVANVTFTVKAGVSPGNITLTNTPGAADAAGNPVTVAGVAGSINVATAVGPNISSLPASKDFGLINSGVNPGLRSLRFPTPAMRTSPSAGQSPFRERMRLTSNY